MRAIQLARYKSVDVTREFKKENDSLRIHKNDTVYETGHDVILHSITKLYVTSEMHIISFYHSVKFFFSAQ
jgi:hypothetical protein